ncbi:hypothetical protein A8B82_21175 [Sulfitobacter sp. EhC04]|uniref:hypothetical protein n=1 Tax=Sulfitobacter sp. EhC04 TaxID=1849168 RepID=UPI0007F4522C|nr:hypothetical protein [Sulfitobacter sp. EhC04]OAN71108.1 hypothetical protein A8B82_21175 [Sulfitobacter sp. EhC04]
MKNVFLARRIVRLIEGAKINVTTEAASHSAIAALLAAQGMDVRSEVRLSAKSRVDLMVETIAIEVKTGHRRADILRQIKRYSEIDEVSEVILATAIAFPKSIKELGGKKLHIASLSRGWL